MHLFGMPRQFARAAETASGWSAEYSREEAEFRREVLDRWHAERRDGLSAADAAYVVGIPRATLFRWDRRRTDGCLEPVKTGPRTPRKAYWSQDLVNAVRETRLDNPTRGKAKIAAVLQREGWTASESTVGRILRCLMDSGEIVPVAELRMKAEESQLRDYGNQDLHDRLSSNEAAEPDVP